jgi:uncharacterized protein (TIGR01777 family)
MRVLVSGASGLIGRGVSRRLSGRGDEVVPLVRREGSDGVVWNPRTGRFDAAAAEDADAVVHLAGASIASGRWSTARKRVIFDSRVVGTRLLCDGLAGLARPPRVLIAASATGFYGDGGELEQTETSGPGRGFLADVCKAWESATESARARGIRVVHLRIGLVLAREGGALALMLPIFKLGLGGQIGDGRQWMSWISLCDTVRIVELALTDETLAGPVNAVAPNPVRNAEFSRILARVLGRPALLPVPAALLRLVGGEMAQELLLSGARVVPSVLAARGFCFEQPLLEGALKALLAAPA